MAVGIQGEGFRNQLLPALNAGTTVVNKNGIFLFTSLPPAKGNLVMAFAPKAGGSIGGNVYPQGFNWGVWDATGTLKQHFGVDISGRLYIVGPDGVLRIFIDNGTGSGPRITFLNDFGATLLVIDPNLGGTFQYQDKGSAVQGPLIGAQVSKNTTDPVFGGAINGGVDIIDPVFGDFITLVGATIAMGIGVIFTRNLQIAPAQAPANNKNPYLQIDGPEQTTASHLQLQIEGASPDGTVAAGIIEGIVSGSTSLTRQTAATHEIQGSLGLTGVAQPAQPPAGDGIAFVDTAGLFKYLMGLAGDTNVYLLGEAETRLGSNFTINQTTNQIIFSFTVGIGTYDFEVWLVVSNAVAADVADFQFQGPAASQALVKNETKTTGTATVGYGASSTYTNTFSSQNFAGNQDFFMKGSITFSAAGTLTFNGKQHVALNNITVFANSTMKIKRVP